MKKPALLLCFCISLLFLNCSKKLVVNQQTPLDNKVTIGEKIKINSKILGEEREIWVSVPTTESYFSPLKNLPVVYLLDGNAHFYSVMGMMHQLSSVNGNTICPPMIVVGILNTNRMRDLTPTKDDAHKEKRIADNSGGGEKFMSFIEKELIPYIDSAYSTAPYRMLIGHSLGGLTVINALQNHSDLFNSYISIDPSLWWHKQKLMKEFDGSQKNFQGKSLFVSMANSYPTGLNASNILKDSSSKTDNLHSKSILQFSDILKSKTKLGLNYKWKYYEDDTHGSVPLITEYDALRFIFSFYQTPNFEFLSDSNVKNLDEVLVSHYKNVSKQMGYEVLPPENLVNNLGYRFKSEKLFDKSFACFQLNIKHYPTSPNVYDSMGDFYLEKGDKEKAIENFKKVLTLKDWSFTKDKLKKLEAEK